MSGAREEILGNIRKALTQKVAEPFPEVTNADGIYPEMDPSVPLEVRFAEEWLKLDGKFVFSQNWAEFTQNLTELIELNKWEAVTVWHPAIQKLMSEAQIPQLKVSSDLSKSNAGIISVECLIARTGTVCMSARNRNGRTLGVYPEVCIVVAATDQIVPDFSDAFQVLNTKYGSVYPSMVSFMSGPSRTADIEKTLVLGAHGPKEVIVMLVDNPNE